MVNGILTIPISGRISPSSAVGSRTFPLDRFIAGPENRMAAAVLRPLLNETGTHSSPLVLFGPRGCGKSHLAQGLAALWRERLSKGRVLCTSGSEFAQELSAAMDQGRLEAWRRDVRDVQLFVLEDVGQLADKRSAQQELIRTLDALAEHDALVVVTARTLPTQATMLTAALRSRLSGGLAIGLSWPGPAARRAILDHVARDTALSKRAVHSLASGLGASAPTLVSALFELDLDAREHGRSLDGKQVRRFVSDRDDAKMPSLREIAVRTARYFELKVSDLTGPRRPQPVVTARGVAMYLARQLTDKSFEQIGVFFGRRDHTTVMYGCRRTEKLIRRDQAIRRGVAELKRWLAGG